MKTICMGVIGCGSIANTYHLPAMERVETIRLKWACDLIESRAAEAKERFGFQQTTLDYHDLLGDPEVEAVCIFTKIEMHAKIAIEAARAGKNIFMQKPFAYSIEEGRTIIRAVEENGVKLIPSFMHSYMDGSLAAKALIEGGTIGDIVHIRMRNSTRNPPETAPSYGGCMMDIGCHGIDLVRTLSGEQITEVFAGRVTPPTPNPESMYGEAADLNGIENSAILHYTLSNGASVCHEVLWSQIAATVRFEMEIYGTKGVVYLYNPHRSEKVYLGVGPEGKQPKDLQWREEAFEPTFFGERQHRDMAAGLMGDGVCAKGPRDGFVPLQVIEAMRRSIVSRKSEKVLGV
ncbi:MAG: Gfo/Idh/MocA family oxidoreductase [Provencibacterium sp.]|jgi:UDP-N-acetylglucosamine 3-dehydrogenase|nr:Gfo/Idh/MocA family oxidoreductase [Provencibacterium sp.]